MPVKQAAQKPGEVKVIKGRLSIRRGKPATVISTRTVYRGPLFRVDKETVNEAGGAAVLRDIVHHAGSVVILALDDANRKNPLVVLERQYRHAAGQFLYEIPAGKIEPGEHPLAAARRELAEETGFRAKRWKQLARYYASPGVLTEWMQTFVAEGLTPGATNFDEDERLEILQVPFSELLRLIDKGQIQDGKTLIAALSWARMRSAAKRR